MTDRPAEPREVELDAMAWGFLGSRYAGDHFGGWPIDRRLDAYLRRHGLTRFANDGNFFASLLDQVMGNIPLVRKRRSRSPRPDPS